MSVIYYNSYLYDSETLLDIDKLIANGLSHTELEGKRYTDKLSGEDELIKEAEMILSSSL